MTKPVSLCEFRPSDGCAVCGGPCADDRCQCDPVVPNVLSGAWAKPLRARVKHFFPDESTLCLCGAYMTRQVKPSEFGANPYVRCCPTCVRKADYFDA